jgi:peptidoglycan biosynthesis protein MviN/MurJ (putative lipid II flippase)
MLLSMGIQILTLVAMGAGSERDALFVALSVPQFVNVLLVGTVGIIVTPAVLGHSSPRGQRKTATYALLLISSTAAILGWAVFLFRLRLADILAPGFDIQNRILSADLLKTAASMLPLQAASSVLTGYLIAQETVILPTVALGVGYAVTLAAIAAIGKDLSAHMVIWATLAGASVTLVVQLWAFFEQHEITPDVLPDSYSGLNRIYRQTTPLLLSGLITRSTPLIERNLASSVGVGTISCLGYAGNLISFLVNSTGGPTATAYFARMCSLWNEGKRDDVGRLLARNLLVVLTLALSTSGFFVILGRPLLRLGLGVTRMAPKNVDELIKYCTILMVAYVFLSLGGLLARMFYVTSSSMEMALLDCLGTVFYLVIAIVASRRLGGLGLAIATCLQAAFMGCLFGWWTSRQFSEKCRNDAFCDLISITIRWVGAIAAAFVVEHLLRHVTGLPLSIAATATIYTIGLWPAVSFVLRRTHSRDAVPT